MKPEDMLIELLNVYSPSGSEGEVSRLIRDYMDDLGFQDPVIDSQLNVVSVNGNGKPAVFICGHEDTVPGILPVRRDGDLFYGRGAVDAKSSLLALILGAKRAMDNGFNGKILISAASGEESDSKGINTIMENYSGYNYAIFGEPGGAMNITAGYKGRILLKIDKRTETHHASSAWMEVNAIDSLMDFWLALRSKYGKNKDFNSITAGITRFQGGEYDNMTPEHASMYIDIRYPKSISENDLIAEIKSDMKNILVEDYSFNIENRTEPYISDIKSPLVKSFKEAITKNNMSPRLIFKSGSGDMNNLGNLWRIPVITYGPGDTRLSHTQNEVINIRDFYKSVDVIADSLKILSRYNMDGNQG
ncbi:MAG: M20/M25/M40 family metallo-hydrolase [Ferroplasma sp.]|uniref:M20/M25/M40 family metallo-hydrolase n=1 Tax=Ferroplasma sp. TaxID=2591003 RepID=UPI0028149B21|nr:M20/M25/M40 family metallo-hydrolase [Ferroplasma sp.]WMT52058.1 MAG: M20/M25/M40 family metallo-hydrolase [Ferroplasma sp.]